MNTIVKIKNFSRAGASAKNVYNLTRQKNKDKNIFVLEENSMPKPKRTVCKKEIKSLRSKLCVYAKRLEKAILQNKEKSIATNKKNIKKIEEQLQQLQVEDKRQKHFTEFTVALTNSQKGEYAENWSKLALEHFKKEFPTLQVVSAVEHRDQHSPHIHILMYSPDKPVTQVLAQYAGQKNTDRDSLKKAYSLIAHKFHSWANTNIAYNRLNKLHRGRKYVSLGQYKQKGNFYAKKALKSNLNNLDELHNKIKSLNSKLETNNSNKQEEFELSDVPDTSNLDLDASTTKKRRYNI